jgi:ribonuclease E
LIQMTRKRIGTGLLEAFSTECPVCHGRGYELHDMPVESHRHADGGARDARPRDRRGNAQGDSEKAPDNVASAGAAESNNEAAPEERPARNRGGRSRRSAAGPGQDAAKPQSEPVVLS